MANPIKTIQVKRSTGSTDNDTFATKGYVDEHTTNGVWKRIGTEISVTNDGDTVSLATAGVVKGMLVDSSNVAHYNSHPTFIDDTAIIDKKYVDDQIIPETQFESIYVAKNGDDANSGKSPNSPLLTISAALTKVAAETPGVTNPWSVQVLDAGIYTSGGTIPAYTHLHAPLARLEGSFTLNRESKITCDVIYIPSGTTCITINGFYITYIKVNEVSSGSNTLFLSLDGSAQLYLTAKNINLNDTNTKIYSATAGVFLAINAESFYSTTASTADPAARIQESILNKGVDGDMSFKTSFGKINFNAGGNNNLIFRNDDGIALETIDYYLKFTKMPEFLVTLTTNFTQVTGQGAVYKIPFNQTVYDIDSNFNFAGKYFLTPVDGIYSFGLALQIFNILPGNIIYEVRLQIDNDSSGSPITSFPIKFFNVTAVNSGNKFYERYQMDVKLDANVRVYFTLMVDGETIKNIGVESGTDYYGRLIRAL